jgi:hypothetical protein
LRVQCTVQRSAQRASISGGVIGSGLVVIYYSPSYKYLTVIIH